MGNLKEDLKSAASLLKSGSNEQVIELLKDHAEDEKPDYRVVCFLALAYSNLSDYAKSYEKYKKAVEIEPENLMAWKGLFKLFEAESLITPDQFSLRVCEFMLKNGEEKQFSSASRALRRIHVELKLWTEVLEKFDALKFHEDPENLKKILENLKDSENFQNLLEKVFKALAALDVLKTDEKIHVAYCKFSKSIDSVLELVENHKSAVADEWVQKMIFEHSCQEFFVKGQFPRVVEHVTCAPAPTLSVINALRNNDKSGALEALDTIADRSVYPDSMLFVGLLGETENWESVEKLVVSIRSLFPHKICDGWMARATLEIGSVPREKLQEFLDLALPEFAVETLKIAILLGNFSKIEELLTEFDENSNVGITIRLVKSLYSPVEAENSLSESVKLAEQLPKETSQDFVLAAELRLRAGLEANSLLVKAAKLNVRCSRAFFLLGKSLSVKNPAKARSLIERAVQIRPGSEEYVRALNELLIVQEESPEERLKVLRGLLARRKSWMKPFWLADAISTIHLELDNITEAIDELQQMVRVHKDNKSVWARLADAYTRKGHLRAAVSSYAQLAEMDGGHEFSIPMIRVLLQLREFGEALEKVTELRKKFAETGVECCSDSAIVLDFTEAEVHLNLHESTCGEPKKAHLKEALRLLTRCVDKEGSCRFSTVFKLLGDLFLILGKYSGRVIPYFEVEKSWKVTSPLDCVTKSVSFYMTVLRSRNHDALAWYDVSVALLSKFKLEEDAQLLQKVQKMLQHALTLTTVDSLLSSIWTVLAETKRLAEQPVRHQLHCLSRALQLNKANDAAWLKVAILCMEVGMMNEASRVLEQTIKYNPHNADAWCAWAETAHLQGDAHEALAMFRQALCIRPVPAAVVGYSSYLCESLKKKHIRFDSATAALDFEPILDLRNLGSADEKILYHLGLLADLFGWYPESLECFKLCKNPEIAEEIQRALIKTGVLHPELEPEAPVKLGNSRLAGMLELSNTDNFAFLTAELEVYGQLYQLIGDNDSAGFRKLYMHCFKEISVPLFVAGLIIRKINLPTEFIRTMHDVVPRHELIDYFPTVLPDGMDNGLHHLEQDGEEPFRYRHRAAHKMLQELKRLREEAEAQKPPSPEESLEEAEIS